MASVNVSSMLDRLFADCPPAAVVAPAVAPVSVAPVSRPAVAAPARVPLVPIMGNTYPVKDALKALGARPGKDAAGKFQWFISADKSSQAQAIVAGAPKKVWTKTDSIAAAARKRGETPGTCSECGGRCKYPYTTCWDCKNDD